MRHEVTESRLPAKANRLGFTEVDFLGLPLSVCDTVGFIRALIAVSARSDGGPSASPALVTYLNAHCVNLAARDAAYAAILTDHADCVYADGQAIVWASRWLGRPVPERVNAADFLFPFCRAAAAAGRTLYFLGCEPGVAEAAADACRTAAPGLRIVGTGSGFFAGSDGSPGGESAAVARVAASGANILVLGMGVPRQEQFAMDHRAELNVSAIWCTGAMFDFYAGRTRRAPPWMRRAGLEWLHRLAMEPRRMFRRYVVGNVEFLWRVIRG